MLLPQSANRLAELGANIEITAEARYLPQSVVELIMIARRKGTQVKVHAGGFLPQSLEEFVALAPGQVTVVI